MSTLLKEIEDDFDRRVAIRRRMLDHMGIMLDESVADAAFADNRETLLACSRCASLEACERWIDADYAGAPMFCAARAAFLRLQAITLDHGRARRRVG